MLALPVAKVTGRAVMVVVGVLVGRIGRGRRARRPDGRLVVRSILVSVNWIVFVYLELFVCFCANEALFWISYGGAQAPFDIIIPERA
jgi:hypothetical protein